MTIGQESSSAHDSIVPQSQSNSSATPLKIKFDAIGLARRISAVTNIEGLNKLAQESNLVSDICNKSRSIFELQLMGNNGIPEPIAKESIRLFLEQALMRSDKSIEFHQLQQPVSDSERAERSEWQEALNSFSSASEEKFLGETIVSFFPENLKAYKSEYILYNTSVLSNYMKNLNLSDCSKLRDQINQTLNREEANLTEFPSTRVALSKLLAQLNLRLRTRMKCPEIKDKIKQLGLDSKLYDKSFVNLKNPHLDRKSTVSEAFGKFIVNSDGLFSGKLNVDGYRSQLKRWDLAYGGLLLDYAELGVDFTNNGNSYVYKAIENMPTYEAVAFIKQLRCDFPDFKIDIQHQENGVSILDLAIKKDSMEIVRLLFEKSEEKGSKLWQKFLEKQLNACGDDFVKMKKVIDWFCDENIRVDFGEVQITSLFGKSIPLLTWIGSKVYESGGSQDRTLLNLAGVLLKLIPVDDKSKQQFSDLLKMGLQTIVTKQDKKPSFSWLFFYITNFLLEKSPDISHDYLELEINAVTTLIQNDYEISDASPRKDILTELKTRIIKAEAKADRKPITPLLVRLIDISDPYYLDNYVDLDVLEVIKIMKKENLTMNLHLRDPKDPSRSVIDAAIPKNMTLVRLLSDSGVREVNPTAWKDYIEEQINGNQHSDPILAKLQEITKLIEACKEKTPGLHMPLSTLIVKDKESHVFKNHLSLIEWAVKNCENGDTNLINFLLADESIKADKIHLHNAFELAYEAYQQYLADNITGTNKANQKINYRLRILDDLAKLVDMTNPPKSYRDFQLKRGNSDPHMQELFAQQLQSTQSALNKQKQAEEVSRKAAVPRDGGLEADSAGGSDLELQILTGKRIKNTTKDDTA